MIVHQVKQRSDEWFALRRGIVTASEVSKIVTPTGKLSKQADGYMDTLLDEWIRGVEDQDQENEYQSMYMQRGIVLEQRAIDAYEMVRNVDVQKVGFVTIDNGLLGCSPDGLVGEPGLIELKCPKGTTHMHYMRTRELENDYKPQLQCQLLITERGWVDIVSYHPDYPLVILRQERDEDYQKILKGALNDFVEALLNARQDIYENYPQVRERLEALAAA